MCLPFGPTTWSTSSSISSAMTPSPTPTLSANSPSFAAPTSSPSASCTHAGNTASCPIAASATDTVVSFTAVPPSICGGSPPPLPTRAGAARGTAVKFYELRDNLTGPPHEGDRSSPMTGGPSRRRMTAACKRNCDPPRGQPFVAPATSTRSMPWAPPRGVGGVEQAAGLAKLAQRHLNLRAVRCERRQPEHPPEMVGAGGRCCAGAAPAPWRGDDGRRVERHGARACTHGTEEPPAAEPVLVVRGHRCGPSSRRRRPKGRSARDALGSRVLVRLSARLGARLGDGSNGSPPRRHSAPSRSASRLDCAGAGDADTVATVVAPPATLWTDISVSLGRWWTISAEAVRRRRP